MQNLICSIFIYVTSVLPLFLLPGCKIREEAPKEVAWGNDETAGEKEGAYRGTLLEPIEGVQEISSPMTKPSYQKPLMKLLCEMDLLEAETEMLSPASKMNPSHYTLYPQETEKGFQDPNQRLQKLASTTLGFEKLPEKYTISLGPPDAEIAIVEYFSLSCPLCLKLIKTEFESIYQKYCASGRISWTFHPYPQDITTLQLMICLGELLPEQKWEFFWEVVNRIKLAAQEKNASLMKEVMERFGKEVPLLHDMKWIETTEAYREAFNYLQQKGIPEEIPTITKNDVIFDEIPTKKFIEETLLRH